MRANDPHCLLDTSTRAPALAGGSRSGFRPTGVVESATGLPVGLHGRGESAMIEGARYVHTNLIARNWQALARFYETHFGCIRVPPERDSSGPELEAGAGIPNA